MKPIEYPAWRYHKDHEPRLLHSDADHEKLPGEESDWHDNPTDAGVKLEVFEASGGYQKVRRVAGYVPESVEAKSEESQGEEIVRKQDVAEMSEDELREVLIAHGYSAKKVRGKSKEQLLALYAS